MTSISNANTTQSWLSADAPDDEPSLLDALRAELKEYYTKRAAFQQKPDVDPQYRAGILRMWEHTIGQQLAKIAREEGKG